MPFSAHPDVRAFIEVHPDVVKLEKALNRKERKEKPQRSHRKALYGKDPKRREEPGKLFVAKHKGKSQRSKRKSQLKREWGQETIFK